MCLYICQWRIQHRAYPAYAPPPLIGENIAFSCICFIKVKLTIFFSAKMWLTPPPLAHSWSAIVCSNKQYQRAGAWCLLGKSEIADSSPALAFHVSKSKMFPPCSILKIEYCGQPTWPRDNVLGRRPTGLNFKSCVWRAVSPHSYHHPQEVLLAQFSLYVNKCGVKPHSFYFITFYKAN